MKMRPHSHPGRPSVPSAFSIIEVMFTMSIIGIVFVALYEGLRFGYSEVLMARENTRASQILVEKMETIRLYTWDQINSNGFMPSNFIAEYYPMGGTRSGTTYTGTVSVVDSGLSTSYADDMKKVVVSLNWCTMGMPRTRTNSTYVTRNGLQTYVY